MAFYFDLETGGLAQDTSILSFGYAQGTNPPEALYAEPETGSRLYKWSEQNIWENVKKQKNVLSEKEQLNKFIGVLNTLPQDTELVGWNIGYNKTISEGTQGYDLQKLLQRASHYGVRTELESALKGKNVRDVGREFSLHVAKAFAETSGVHQYLKNEAFGYLKHNRLLGGLYRMDVEQEARYVQGFMPGWKLEDTYELIFNRQMTGAHTVSDVEATREIHQWLQANPTPQFDPERVRTLAKKTHKRILISNLYHLKPGMPEAVQEEYSKIITTGVEAGYTKEELESGLKEFAEQRGANVADIISGQGAKESYRRFSGILNLPSSISKKAGKTWNVGLNFIKQHKVLTTGLALGAAAMALQVGSWFSGDKDEYNTIEGLSHKGIAKDSRRRLTDFGSPVDLAKATNRAEELYSQFFMKVFGDEGLDALSIVSRSSATKELGVLDLSVMRNGTELARLSREFRNNEVNLFSIQLADHLQGLGLSRKLYQHEVDIFRQIGYQEGEAVTSLVSNPITARMQMQLYQSAPSFLPENWNDIRKAILSKSISKEDYGNKVGFITEFIGKIPGMPEKGLGVAMRHKMTPFQSWWDPVKNLIQGKNIISQVVEDAGFQKALLNAKKLGTLGKPGTTANVYRMEATLPSGKKFQFARKVSVLPVEQEAELMRRSQLSVTPNVYGHRVQDKEHILDMELFEGKTFTTLTEAERQQYKLMKESAYHKLHMTGTIQVDTNPGNMMLVDTPYGKQVGIIDLGYGESTKDLPAHTATQLQRMETETLSMDVGSAVKQRREMRDIIHKERQAKMEQGTNFASTSNWSNGKYGGRNHAR